MIIIQFYGVLFLIWGSKLHFRKWHFDETLNIFSQNIYPKVLGLRWFFSGNDDCSGVKYIIYFHLLVSHNNWKKTIGKTQL